MKKSREFNSILNECLDRILAGSDDLAACLRDYPEHAAELEPLLRIAMAAKMAAAIEPNLKFRARARYEFQLAVQEAKVKKHRRFFIWQPVWGTVMAVFLVCLLGGSITVAAAGNSMPDEPLYPVKIATEEVRLRLTPSPIGKAELNAELADRRVAEIVHLADKGESREVELVARRLSDNLERIAEFGGGPKRMPAPLLAPAPAKAPSQPDRNVGGVASVPPQSPTALDRNKQVTGNNGQIEREKLRAAVARYAVRHPAVLREALRKAPESVKPALRRALALSEEGYQKARQSLED